MGSAVTAVLTAAGILVLLFVIRRYAGKQASLQCEKSPVSSRKVDRNPDHYGYHVMLRVDGMTCENCARDVECALHEIPGVWAEADLEQQRVRVWQKDRIPVEKLCAAVEKAGYHAHR